MNIELTATQVKEQPLSCKKCNKMFHKKCTNRRAVRGGNWNKEPWYCPSCTVVEHSQASALLTDGDNVLSTVVLSTPQTGAQRPSLLAEDNSTIDVNVATNEPALVLNPVASGFHHPTPPSSLGQTRRFPNNSIRQRASNIAVLDPEVEFQKTAIDACRSTIVQQEAELKRLRESNDVKNKKIMQLEGQVGIATSYLSSRDPNLPGISTTTSGDQLSSFNESVKVLQAKINVLFEYFPKSPVVNVYSGCHSHKPVVTDTGTQTNITNGLPILSSHNDRRENSTPTATNQVILAPPVPCDPLSHVGGAWGCPCLHQFL